MGCDEYEESKELKNEKSALNSFAKCAAPVYSAGESDFSCCTLRSLRLEIEKFPVYLLSECGTGTGIACSTVVVRYPMEEEILSVSVRSRHSGTSVLPTRG